MKLASLLKYILPLVGLTTVNAPFAADAPVGTDEKPGPGDWQKMPPEERAAKRKEMREKLQNLTPEQREAKRKEWRERIEKKIEELKKKKKEGGMTEQEATQLGQWEQRLKMWDQRSKDVRLAQPADKKDENK